jgi:hypothetical protein
MVCERKRQTSVETKRFAQIEPISGLTLDRPVGTKSMSGHQWPSTQPMIEYLVGCWVAHCAAA